MKKIIQGARAVQHLMDLLRIEGPSGAEGDVAACITKKLIDAGCKPSWIRHDQAHRKIQRGFTVGNLIVKLPGTIRGPRRLLMGHMDTVPLCRGAVPVKKGRRIVPKGKTGLGADNRTAVACLVTVIEAILKSQEPHPPLTILFTVGEEIGLLGARYVNVRALGSPRIGINIDSGEPARFVVGAIGAERWVAEVFGVSSHAGMHPEDGISATLIASRALAEVAQKGFFGRIKKGKHTGTSNVGRIEGGEATNQVTDYLKVIGECRSHDPVFLKKITQTYHSAFERAVKLTKNRAKRTGSVKFVARAEYEAFCMKEDDPARQFAVATAKGAGFTPSCIVVNGGLDANYMNRKGVPTITMGAGQHGAHTTGEYVDLQEYLDGCRLAYALATA